MKIGLDPSAPLVLDKGTAEFTAPVSLLLEGCKMQSDLSHKALGGANQSVCLRCLITGKWEACCS